MIDSTVLFPFCGLGAGALGFLDAQITMLGAPRRFRSLGGIDNDAAACRDFEYLTQSPALCADIGSMTPAELRAFAGEHAPDVVFGSPPCKGYSALLSKKAGRSKKYRRMNRLALDWVRLVLDTWPDEPPALMLLENVPRIASRGRRLLTAIRSRLRRAGYVFHESAHDCGELGGLAQHRQRFLLVARHPRRVPGLLYQPIKKRVRACGEVLGRLPMPAAPDAGPMHELPKISWPNWVRLALIPAGGDWRDLPGVLVDGQPRREVYRRHHVGRWTEPAATVAGSGSNGPSAVADPRGEAEARRRWEQHGEKTPGGVHWFKGKHGVGAWDEPSRAVIGGPSNGAGAVADPRIVPQAGNDGMHWGKYDVRAWDAPAATVIGATRVGSGAQSVADPRPAWFRGAMGVARWEEPAGTVTDNGRPGSGRFSVDDPRPRDWFHHVYRIVPWDAPAGTVTGAGKPSSGGVSVADPRVRSGYDHAYGVLRWDEASPTVAAGSHPGQGAYSVADVRTGELRAGAYGVLPWQEAAKTVTGEGGVPNGPFAVADPRRPEAPPVAIVDDVRKPPFILMEQPGRGRRKASARRVVVPVVIIAADGTWHRPLTTLELAALQGLPLEVRGAPLKLDGSSHSAWRERIGNAVPVATARAIAEQMLITLTSAAAGAWMLSSGGDVWVDRAQEGAAL